jgi:hypothetical protein
MHRSFYLMAILLLPGSAGNAAAQDRTDLAPTNQAPAAAITVVVGGKVGGKKIQASGTGSCRHAADASIRGVSASLWTVEYSRASDGGGLKQLHLTLWRPKDESPDQLSLSVETKAGSHRIETGNPEETKGEGSVTILPSGPGGRLEISGKDASGKPVQISIDCSAFAGVPSEGD